MPSGDGTGPGGEGPGTGRGMGSCGGKKGKGRGGRKGPGPGEAWDPAAARKGKAAAGDRKVRHKGAVKAVVKAAVRAVAEEPAGDRDGASSNSRHPKLRAVLPSEPRGGGRVLPPDRGSSSRLDGSARPCPTWDRQTRERPPRARFVRPGRCARGADRSSPRRGKWLQRSGETDRSSPRRGKWLQRSGESSGCTRRSLRSAL